MFPQELAQKIKGYQEQIASLNSKCKMLTMKAKNATMLLTVTEVEGLGEDLDGELLPATSAHPSVVMVSRVKARTAGCPALSSPTAPWLLAPSSLWLTLGISSRACRLELSSRPLNSLLPLGPCQYLTL